jgi:hypothetical protein
LKGDFVLRYYAEDRTDWDVDKTDFLNSAEVLNEFEK